MSNKFMDNHIEITPNIAFGKPRIIGHRITVENIMVWHERMGKRAEEIAVEYNLTLADVYAALAYYYDHKEEIDKRMEEGQAFAEALRKQSPSILTQRTNGRKS